MEIPKILPKFTEANVSKSGYLNVEDLQKMIKNLVIFFIPTITLYATQLTGSLTGHTVLNVSDLWPNSFVIGAMEAYVIAAVLDYLKKLNDSKN